MVTVYFDEYGPNFDMIIKHQIKHAHVSYVRQVYVFYVAKVGHPLLDNVTYSATL